MAKKDFKETLRSENVEDITKSFFSDLTLEETKKNKEPKKRVKTTIKSNNLGKENKTHSVTIRLTDTQYKELVKGAKRKQSGTITNFIIYAIERELKQ